VANLRRLKYLRDVVIPHLEGMPTIEDVVDNYLISVCEDEIEIEYETISNRATEVMRKKEGTAILNFNCYLDNNTPIGFDPLPVSKNYDCSREGCLVGWYVYIGEDENGDIADILDEHEREAVTTLRVGGYHLRHIAKHFGIESGVAQMLFGPALRGWESMPDDMPQEDTLWRSSQLNITKLALSARTQYLDNIIRQFEEEEALNVHSD